MFIAQNSQNASRRSEERNVSRVLPVYLSSAPPNGDTEVFSPRSINMPPLNGVKPVLPLQEMRYCPKRGATDH